MVPFINIVLHLFPAAYLLVYLMRTCSCRDARNMARDVHTAFYEIAEEMGGLTHTQAVDYFKKLMTKGRYSQDVWS